MNEIVTTQPQERAVALQVSHPQSLALTTLAEIKEFCQMAASSGLVPKELSTPERVFIAVTMGMEVGLSPMQAVQNIAVINGRPCMWGDVCLGLVQARADCEDVIESFEKEGEEGVTAVCEVHRAGRTPVKRKFTVAMAKKAGLWGKAGPWTNYSMRMLQMRARSWALRDSFPDALKGIGLREEVRDYPAKEAKEVKSRAVVYPGEEAAEPAPQLTDAEPAPNENGEYLWDAEEKK